MAKPRYVSTRGWAGEGGVSFERAVLMGLAPDGGLFVPTHFPQVTAERLQAWRDLSFQDLAYEVISLYVPEDEVDPAALRSIVDRSYSTFRDPRVTPVVQAGGEGGPTVLELFHGPTFAFKDVALQFLGNLFEHVLSRRGEGEDTITVLGATSGDTGSSAIMGLRGKAGVEVFILFPEGRVSEIQERQMTTVLDENIHCVAVEGTFDDAQAIVKACFRDAEFNAEVHIAAVNSINWARILAQIVYYFYASFRVDKDGTAKASFSVPTGNFGDILAGYYAKKMGLPVQDLLASVNSNDILHRFFTTGRYDRSDAVTPTIAPSMDICVSSNFERFLYHCAGEDAAALAALMEAFEKTGKLEPLPEGLLEEARGQMRSARVGEEEISATIKEVHEAHGYLLDPHSAIGVKGAMKDADNAEKSAPGVTVVCLACAHWAKFPDAVGKAIGAEAFAACETPPELKRLAALETRKTVLPATECDVRAHVRAELAKMKAA